MNLNEEFRVHEEYLEQFMNSNKDINLFPIRRENGYYIFNIRTMLEKLDDIFGYSNKPIEENGNILKN